MSIVTKVYDSQGSTASIICVSPDSTEDNNLHTKSSAFSRTAAADKGTFEGLLRGQVTVVWWRQGVDVHILAIREAVRNGRDGEEALATVQRAVCRVPSDCAAVSCVLLRSPPQQQQEGGDSPSALIGIVSVTSLGEVVCARVHVGINSPASTAPSSSSVVADTVGGSSSLFVRALPDVFTSLESSHDASNNSGEVCAAAVASTYYYYDDHMDGEEAKGGKEYHDGMPMLTVLLATTRGHLRHLSISDDGVVSSINIVSSATAAVSAIATLSSPNADNVPLAPSFVLGRVDGSVSLLTVGGGCYPSLSFDEESDNDNDEHGAKEANQKEFIVGYVPAHLGAPIAITARKTNRSSFSRTILAVATESGDAVVFSSSSGGSTADVVVVVPKPSDTASVASLFIRRIEEREGSSAVLVGFSGVELWSIPTTLASAFRRHTAEASSVVCSVGLRQEANAKSVREGEGVNSSLLWLVGPAGYLKKDNCYCEDDDDLDEMQPSPFWFTHSSSSSCSSGMIMALADAVSGEVELHAAHNPTEITSAVGSSVIGHYSPEEAVNTQYSSDAPNTFEVSVVPLEGGDNNNAANTTKALRVGLDLLSKIPSAVSSLQYVFYRVLACPNRFANYSEFSELRTDALMASFTLGPMEEVTEDDVRAALDWLSACEDTKNPFYATTMYAHSAAIHDLSSRLIALIVVFMAWVGTSTYSFVDSEVTAEVGHRAEVLVAAIRALHALGHGGCQHLISATCGVSSGDDDGECDEEGCTAVVSSLVNELSQISYGDVLDVARVARTLLAVVPYGPVGSRASAQWISVMKSRSPALAHFHVVSSVLNGNNTSGKSGAVLLAEVYGICSHLSELPVVVARELLSLMGLYAQQQYGALPAGSNPATAADGLSNDVEALIDVHPALTAKLYKVLLLRRLVASAHSSVIPSNLIESAFLPDLLIVRRYVAELTSNSARPAPPCSSSSSSIMGATATSYSSLSALLNALVIDVQIVQCRAAMDDEDYTECVRLLTAALREVNAALQQHAHPHHHHHHHLHHHYGAINVAPLTSRKESIVYYVSAVTEAALVSGRGCALVSLPVHETEITEMIAQRLYALSFSFYSFGGSHAQAVAPVTSSSAASSYRPSPAQQEANEARRIAAAQCLYDFLCRRSAYGLAAHALFSIAAAARSAAQATPNTANCIVQLLALAVAAIKAVPPVPPPPSHLSVAAEADKTTSGLSSGHRHPMPMPSMIGQSAFVLSDLRPMSGLDAPILEKRLHQARCEMKLQRIPRNVAKGPWREDGAEDKARITRLVDELIAVRLWPEARKMSLLAGLDVNKVIQCEAADLAAGSYLVSSDLAEQWDLFIDRVCAMSTVENGFLPLRKALAAALFVNHRHVPPRLKLELSRRDLGGLILVMLGSGKQQQAGTNAATSLGNHAHSHHSLARDTSTVSVDTSLADPTSNRRLAGSVILEVLALASRYVEATDDTAKHTRSTALIRRKLAPNAFISYPLLERIAATAQWVLSSSEDAGDAVNSSNSQKRKKEVREAAKHYLNLLSKRNGKA